MSSLFFEIKIVAESTLLIEVENTENHKDAEKIAISKAKSKVFNDTNCKKTLEYVHKHKNDELLVRTLKRNVDVFINI